MNIIALDTLIVAIGEQPEAAKISGIPFVMDVDREEVEAILDA